MGNCLKTQLKEKVNNNNLPILGTALIQVIKADTIESGYQRELTLKVNGTVTVSVDGNGTFTVNSTSGTEETEKTFTNQEVLLYFKNDNYNIKIKNKYEIEKLHVHRLYTSHKIFKFNLASLSYCIKLKVFDCTYTDTDGDIKELTNLPALKEFDIKGSQITGNVSTMSQFSSMTYFRLSNGINGNIAFMSNMSQLTEFELNKTVYGNWSSISNLSNLNFVNTPEVQIEGDIANFTNSVGITYLNLMSSKASGNIDSLGKLTSATEMNLYNNIIGGSVEGFVSAQVSNGRSSVTTSNPIRMFRILQYATFGGSKRSAWWCFVTWESVSKIAILEGGETISACTNVYTKGYTQQEAEIAFPDKTIVRVDA